MSTIKNALPVIIGVLFLLLLTLCAVGVIVGDQAPQPVDPGCSVPNYHPGDDLRLGA
jgi:hypothetical protein